MSFYRQSNVLFMLFSGRRGVTCTERRHSTGSPACVPRCELWDCCCFCYLIELFVYAMSYDKHKRFIRSRNFPCFSCPIWQRIPQGKPTARLLWTHRSTDRPAANSVHRLLVLVVVHHQSPTVSLRICPLGMLYQFADENGSNPLAFAKLMNSALQFFISWYLLIAVPVFEQRGKRIIAKWKKDEPPSLGTKEGMPKKASLVRDDHILKNVTFEFREGIH